MNGLFDSLIRHRVYQILSNISIIFSDSVEEEFYASIDLEEAIILEQLKLRPELINGDSFFISELYSIENYQLNIIYCYFYFDAEAKIILGSDNSPHHPSLFTFPHHKHYYPKAINPPVGFSGNIVDALREFKELMETRMKATT